LFENIISDLFPGIEKPEQVYGNLLKALKKTYKVIFVEMSLALQMVCGLISEEFYGPKPIYPQAH
ncbi:MAG: hypothetical protein RIR83_307, partial [Pseudomonadota bacterium]